MSQGQVSSGQLPDRSAGTDDAILLMWIMCAMLKYRYILIVAVQDWNLLYMNKCEVYHAA